MSPRRLAGLVLVAVLALAQPAAAHDIGAWHRVGSLEVRATHVRIVSWLPGVGHARSGHRFVAVRVAYRGSGSAFAQDWWLDQGGLIRSARVHPTGLAARPRTAKVRPGHPVRGWLVWEVDAADGLSLGFERDATLWRVVGGTWFRVLCESRGGTHIASADRLFDVIDMGVRPACTWDDIAYGDLYGAYMDLRAYCPTQFPATFLQVSRGGAKPHEGAVACVVWFI